ncbi:hypothetical protein M3Y99_00037900 [Aphelenchoides fujianensis]|nr:hypothetical protein M3Y99_00037900 [Aphelenchoides fujianensis]
MNSFGGLPPPVDSYCFFGEKYRTCFDRLHITDGAKVVLLVDLVKTVLETLFFSSKIGYLDSFIVLALELDGPRLFGLPARLLQAQIFLVLAMHRA